MKFLYVILGSLLMWTQVSVAEDNVADFGLDDEIAILNEGLSEDTYSADVDEIGIDGSIVTDAEDEVALDAENVEENENSTTISADPEESTPAEESDAPSTEGLPEEGKTGAATDDSQNAEEDASNKVDSQEDDDNKTKEEYEEEISFYIKNMNLSVEQLDMARYISSDSRLKIEQLLKSIYLLRSQARELEAKSLNTFEAILTEEQREQFHKLRALQDKKREKFEVLHVQPDEEETEDAVSDADSEGAENPEESN